MSNILKNIFVSHWQFKLISFILAIILWITFIPEEKVFSEKTITVPLELFNTPAELDLVEKPPATVDVKVRAPNRLINDVNPSTVHTVLNLQNATVEQTEYTLNRNMVSIPVGAEVKEIYPSQVYLKFEQLKEMELEVVPNLVGKLPEGLKLAKVEILPPKVLIRGPESQFKDEYKVSTRPIDKSSLSQSIELIAYLILPNPNLRLADPDIIVTVKLLIQEDKEEDQNNNPDKK
jgi:YbbR domain-containing protein